MKINRLLYTFLSVSALFLLPSCTEEEIVQPVEEIPMEEAWIDPDMPEEIRNGYSITFNLSLEAVGGKEFASRAVTNSQINDIDYYIDFEKVRILFFVCPDSTASKYTDNGTDYYMSGEHDYFLFESKSRWVSKLSDYESSEQRWQVTAPVFTYGNNDTYRWDDIRYTLQHYPFKVAILVNRPDKVNFGDFDSKYGRDIIFDTDRGPLWGPNESWVPVERRTEEEKSLGDAYDKSKPTINGLHHCQWDAVYSSKNNGDKDTYEGAGVYDFIMENPRIGDQVPLPSPLSDPSVAEENKMGALSSWTKNQTFGTEVNKNAYFLPDKATQGIPMYGVQLFDNIPDTWRQGTPFNISFRSTGQTGQYYSKDIFLLRSLVKLVLRIPKQMEINGVKQDIEVTQPTLYYSNVMARCEPLDVATPTERIWKSEANCEWKDLKNYGPFIDADYGEGVSAYQKRLAWFYGAWRKWWHFNQAGNEGSKSGAHGLEDESYFDLYTSGKGIKDYPHIYNPVMQRNASPRIDPCLVEDDDYTMYVIYTGERNINDPSKFGETGSLNKSKAEVAYFSFIINGGTTYYVLITDYSENTLAKNFATKNPRDDKGTYREDMAGSTSNNWNWPLLRNHNYIFTVKGLGDYSQIDGLDVSVISSEDRTADYWFY